MYYDRKPLIDDPSTVVRLQYVLNLPALTPLTIMENNSKEICSESESNSGSMQDILQLGNRSTRNMNFKPSYRIRKLKNKGALLILVWNCLVASTFHYLVGYPDMFHPTSHIYACIIIIWGLTLPIAGWLADVCLTRYKVMRWSILVMWIASVLVTASSVLSQMPAIERYYHDSANKYITMLLLIVMCLSFGGYQANAVLFGIDQLQDASTDEITSYITWYVSTYFSSGLVIKFIYICLGEAYNTLLPEFLVCICLTIMAVLTLLCDRIFLKEPITQSTKSSNTPSKLNIQDVEVLSLTVKMIFLLVLTLANVNMEDHSQQRRWKMSRHF